MKFSFEARALDPTFINQAVTIRRQAQPHPKDDFYPLRQERHMLEEIDFRDFLEGKGDYSASIGAPAVHEGKVVGYAFAFEWPKRLKNPDGKY